MDLASRQPDVVTIRFAFNSRGSRRITGFCVIGSASPCLGFLIVGARLIPAATCLLSNGFILICVTPGVWVFRRIR